MRTLHILSAGCVKSEVNNTLKLFNSANTEIQAVNTSCGSVDCIRRTQNGDPCDLLILADDAIISSMMIPDYTDGYYIFAGNRMVLTPVSGDEEINETNWIEKLLNPHTTFGHYDPYVDPGGYRAVMACMLADTVRSGLAKQLLEHPGRKIVNKALDFKPDYLFAYCSNPVKQGKPYVQLPPTMDLSDPALNDVYIKASIDLDGNGKNIVCGSAICHALTIPLTAKEPESARSFVDLFLQTDFENRGFLPRSQAVGNF